MPVYLSWKWPNERLVVTQPCTSSLIQPFGSRQKQHVLPLQPLKFHIEPRFVNFKILSRSLKFIQRHQSIFYACVFVVWSFVASLLALRIFLTISLKNPYYKNLKIKILITFLPYLQQLPCYDANEYNLNSEEKIALKFLKRCFSCNFKVCLKYRRFNFLFLLIL